MGVKKLSWILLLVILTFSTMILVNAETRGIRIVINGTEIYPDVSAQSIDGRTMVPARLIAEPLGATVEWDSGKRFVIIKSLEAIIENKQYILPELNNNSDVKIFIDGKEIKPDVAPRSINGRIMVPARFIAEPLGADVTWDSVEKAVIITKRDMLREKPIGNNPFKSNDILMFYPPDWIDMEVAIKSHAALIGSPHQEPEGAPNDPLFSAAAAHKAGINFAARITTDGDWQFPQLNGKELILDIDGKKINMASIHYPGVKEGMLESVKSLIDKDVDIICIDGTCYNYNTQLVNDRGDFSEYSLKNFRAYLIQKYGADKLKTLGIQDIESFNYGAYIKLKYIDYYKRKYDVEKIPFYLDFMDYQLKSCQKFWGDVIKKAREYAESNGKKINFTDNGNWICEDANSPILDAYTNEYNFGYPPKDKIIPFIKLYNGMGKQIALLPNFGSSREILSRPDITNLMKLYTAEAYSSRGFVYVPYASICISETKSISWDTFYPQMDELYPYYDFIHDKSAYYENLESLSKIGIFYSFATVKRTGNTLDQGFEGISNLLVDSHRQYEVIYAEDGDWLPDTVTRDDFNRYDAVIMPNVENISERHLDMLLDYVKYGGNVISFGNFASKDENGQPIKRNELSGLLKEGSHKYGLGRFIYINANIGQEYMSNRNDGNKKIMEDILASTIHEEVTMDNIKNIAMQPYWNSKVKADVIHLVNYDYDLSLQKFNTQKKINIQISLNRELQGKTLEAVFDSPDESGPIHLDYKIVGNIMTLQVPDLITYGVIYIREKGI